MKRVVVCAMLATSFTVHFVKAQKKEFKEVIKKGL